MIFFKEITQPELQIANICTSITNLLKGYTSDDRIKLSLITCADRKLSSYFYISDETSSIKIEELNHHNSTAKKTLEIQRMIIIENVSDGVHPL